MKYVSKFNVLGAIINIKDTKAQNDIADIRENDIADIRKKIAHKYIFIGDSYGAGVPYSSSYGWCQRVPQYMNLKSNEYYSFSSGGAGFTVSGNTFKKCLMDNEHVITDKASITDIVIVGGFNDNAATTDHILDAIGDMCTYIRNNYANAKIKIGCVGWSTDQTYRLGIANNVIPAYSSCGLFGAQYIGGEYIMHRYDMIGDGIHPTHDGYTRLATGIVKGVLTGVIDYYDTYHPVTISPHGYSTDVIGTGLSETLNDGYVQIVSATGGTSIEFVIDPSITIQGGEYHDYGTANLIFAKPIYSGYVNNVNVQGYIEHIDHTFEPFYGQLGFNDYGGIYIRNLTLKNDGTGWKSFSNVLKLSINIPSITFNCQYC